LSVAYHQFVRRDSTLPGLATMLDPEAFVAALRPFLPQVRLEAARIEYVRYKPTKNCIVAYRLDSAGVEMAVYAKGHPGQQQRTPGDQWLEARRLVLEPASITVSISPRDAKLQAIAALADSEAASRWLRELVPERPNLWGGEIRQLRYMPERRYVAQIVCQG